MVNTKNIKLHSGLQNPIIRTPNVARYYMEVTHKRDLLNIKSDTMSLLWEYQTASPKRKLEIRNRIVEINLGLVLSMAKEYCTADDDFLDLVEEGNLGLLIAVDKYDINRQSCFPKLALFYIRRTINRYKTGEGTLVSQKNKFKTASFIKRVGREILQKEEREATSEEIMDIYNERTRQDIHSKEDFADVVYKSIDSMVTTKEDSSNKDIANMIEFNTLSCSYNDYEKKVNDEHIKHMVERYLSMLTRREQEVVKLYYGLGDAKMPHGYQTIAKMLNLTCTRVNQIHTNALERLKKRLIPNYNKNI